MARCIAAPDLQPRQHAVVMGKNSQDTRLRTARSESHLLLSIQRPCTEACPSGFWGGRLIQQESRLQLDRRLKMQNICAGCAWSLDAHCLFSAVLAALKSLKYCVMAFAASLCSLIVGPLFAGLRDARARLHDTEKSIAAAQQF